MNKMSEKYLGQCDKASLAADPNQYDEVIKDLRKRMLTLTTHIRNDKKNIKIPERDLWFLWNVLDDLGELCRQGIESGAEDLEELYNRKSNALKIIQRYRKNKK